MSEYGFLSGKRPTDSDYKALFFTMLSATQQARRILEEAQRSCEAQLLGRLPGEGEEDRT